MSERRRTMRTPSGFVMVLRQDDDVLEKLESLVRDEAIPSASVRGFGFAGTARFGFFDFDRGDYDPREFQDLEITGFTGSLAWQDGKPSIHAHASGGDRNFQVVGGHVLGLTVGRGSFEIVVTVFPDRLERRFDPKIKANILDLG